MLKRILIIIALFCSYSFATDQVKFPSRPNSGFVHDEANIINAKAANSINQLASKLLNEKQVPLHIVTIPSLVTYEASEYSVDTYTRMLFDNWGLGWQERNYGILLLISVGDRKARIEFGRDWDNRYNQEARYIMDDLIIPQFKNGDYSHGVLLGAEALDATVRGMQLPENNIKTAPLWAKALVAIAIILFIISLFRSGKKGWAWALIIALALALWFGIKHSGSGGGFGGGSGGGGGASGSW